MNVDEGTETLTIVELWEKYGREWDAGQVQVATPSGRRVQVDEDDEEAMGEKQKALLLLLSQLEEAGLPAPEREFVFHPKRKWRFDLCWPELKLAGEVEGGIWLQTKTGRGKGHAHPIRFSKDCEKYSEAAILGFLLIRVTAEDGTVYQVIGFRSNRKVQRVS